MTAACTDIMAPYLPSEWGCACVRARTHVACMSVHSELLGACCPIDNYVLRPRPTFSLPYLVLVSSYRRYLRHGHAVGRGCGMGRGLFFSFPLLFQWTDRLWKDFHHDRSANLEQLLMHCSLIISHSPPPSSPPLIPDFQGPPLMKVRILSITREGGSSLEALNTSSA